MTPDPHPASLTELLHHEPWLRALARSLTAERERADDLVQSTWLAALRSPPRGDRDPRPWLARVMRNLSRERWRADRRRDARELDVALERSPETATDDVVERFELKALVARLVLELPEPQRSTVLLRYHEGLPSAEIARRLDIPASTVRSRLKDGLDALRAKLDAAHGGERRTWLSALAPIARGPTTLPGGIAAGVLALAGWLLPALVVVAGVAYLVAGRDGTEESTASAQRGASAPLAAPGSESERSDEIALPAAAPDTGRAALASTAGEPAAREHSLVVTGRVVDESGAALAGVEIGPPRERSEERLALSSADGSFRYQESREIALGFPLTLLLTHPECEWRELDCGEVRTGSTIEAGEIVLRPGGTLSGRVVDERGGPLAGVALMRAAAQALPLDATATPPMQFSSRTFSDREGRFELRGQPIGAWQVWGLHEGFARACSRAATLHKGERVDVGDIVMPRIRRGLLELRFLRPDRSPLARSDVFVLTEGPHEHAGNAGQTRLDGTFLVERERREPARLSARCDDARYRPVSIDGVVPDSGVIEIVLQPAAPLAVRVVDGEGRPIAEAHGVVEVSGGSATYDLNFSRPFRAWDGRDGAFELASPIVPFRVVATAPGFSVAESEILPASEDGASVELVLPALPGITGHVTRGGEPVAGARIELSEPRRVGSADVNRASYSLWRAGEAYSDDQGRFRLDLKGPSEGELLVRAPGLGERRVPIGAVEPRLGLQDVAIELGGGSSISGIARTRAGAPLRDHLVVARHADGTRTHTRTAADGRFRLTGVAAGTWRLRVLALADPEAFWQSSDDAGDLARSGLAVEVADGETAEVALEPAAEARVRGRVLVDGAPAHGWVVAIPGYATFTDQNRAPADGRTLDADGTFELATDRFGSCALRLHGRPRSARDDVELSWSLELGPGEELVRDFEVGFTRLEGRLAVAPRPGERFSLRSAGNQFFWSVVPVVEPDGSFVVEAAPVGDLALLRVQADLSHGFSKFTVHAGERNVVEIP